MVSRCACAFENARVVPRHTIVEYVFTFDVPVCVRPSVRISVPDN